MWVSPAYSRTNEFAIPSIREILLLKFRPLAGLTDNSHKLRWLILAKSEEELHTIYDNLSCYFYFNAQIAFHIFGH